MKTISPRDAAIQMNKCGASHTPFLFAFDFELEHALLSKIHLHRAIFFSEHHSEEIRQLRTSRLTPN